MRVTASARAVSDMPFSKTTTGGSAELPRLPAPLTVRPPTVAIMQPYFFPYAGYFRLFAASDLFVIYDCVQFTRRGWVHRNMLTDVSGEARWLTLPLEKAPQDVLIRDLRFPPNAAELLADRLRRLSLAAPAPPAT